MPYYWQNAMLLNADHFRDILHGDYMADCRMAFATQRQLSKLCIRSGERSMASLSIRGGRISAH